MRVVGIGTDITEISRIEGMLEKHGDFFARKVFTEGEIRYCAGRNRGERFAARWAVKEAVLKALGTGWVEGIAWTDIEVARDASGKPSVVLSGGAKQRANELGISECLVSISHCKTYAVAFVTAVGND